MTTDIDVKKELAEFIDDMVYMVRQTQHTGWEMGSSFCKGEEGLWLKGHCTGSECSVHLPDCGEDERPFTFHTHPITNSEIEENQLINVLSGGRYSDKDWQVAQDCDLIPSTRDTANLESLREISIIGNQCGIAAWIPKQIAEMTPEVRKIEELRKELVDFCFKIRKESSSSIDWLKEVAPSGLKCVDILMELEEYDYHDIAEHFYKDIQWLVGPEYESLLGKITLDEALKRLRMKQSLRARKEGYS